jgi:hypothetical protein
MLLAIWSAIEPGLGIITISISTLRPLTRKFIDPILNLTSRSHRDDDSESNTRPKSPPTEDMLKAVSGYDSYSSDFEKNPIINEKQLESSKSQFQVSQSAQKDPDHFKRYDVPVHGRPLISAVNQISSIPQRTQASQDTWPGRRPSSAMASYNPLNPQNRAISLLR